MIAPASACRAPTRPSEVQDRLLEALGIRPMTVHELAFELGTHTDRLHSTLSRMHRRLGLIEPAGHRESIGGRRVTIYQLHEHPTAWWRDPAYRCRPLCPRCALPDMLHSPEEARAHTAGMHLEHLQQTHPDSAFLNGNAPGRQR